MHHVGGSQLIPCSVHPGPADWVTKHLSCWQAESNDLSILAKHICVRKVRQWQRGRPDIQKSGKRGILIVRSGNMDLLTELRRIKIADNSDVYLDEQNISVNLISWVTEGWDRKSDIYHISGNIKYVKKFCMPSVIQLQPYWSTAQVFINTWCWLAGLPLSFCCSVRQFPSYKGMTVDHSWCFNK